ncbi:alpha-xenorhabdolysin family binary toxin subunit B [Pseudomonas sp.]|uniref:alpha-xenorhabdolysin family binary toxin subunit B n=1 Tax=Pseudomonas sp. TaxID=306 RepID=UPI0028AD787E|nr:alpha-xenorhabdolysin family binary toxin subunit B [Pseudomonas sp.]
MTAHYSALPAPDVKALLGIEKAAYKISYSETHLLLSAVQERLKSLSTLIVSGNQALRRSNAAALVLLDNDLEEPQDDALVFYEEQLVRLRTDLSEQVLPVMQSIQAVTAYADLDLTSLKQESQSQTAQHAENVARAEETLKKREIVLAETESSLALLTAPSVSSLLKHILPTDEELEIILKTLKNPMVTSELLKAAVSKLNKHVELFERGRELTKLLDVSKQMRKSIEQDREVLKRLLDHAQRSSEQVQQYDRAEALLALRGQWLSQMDIFSAQWRALQAAAADAVDSRTVFSALSACRGYLLSVRRQFEAV